MRLGHEVFVVFREFGWNLRRHVGIGKVRAGVTTLSGGATEPTNRATKGGEYDLAGLSRLPMVMCSPSLQHSSLSSVAEWNAPALACEWIVPKTQKPLGTATLVGS